MAAMSFSDKSHVPSLSVMACRRSMCSFIVLVHITVRILRAFVVAAGRARLSVDISAPPIAFLYLPAPNAGGLRSIATKAPVDVEDEFRGALDELAEC